MFVCVSVVIYFKVRDYTQAKPVYKNYWGKKIFL